MRERIRISFERGCAQIPAVCARLGGAIAARYARALTITRYTPNTDLKYDNILARQTHCDTPNEFWVTDISYIITPEGTAYLSAIRDLCGQFIVAHRTAMRQTTWLAYVLQPYKPRQASGRSPTLPCLCRTFNLCHNWSCLYLKRVVCILIVRKTRGGARRECSIGATYS